MLLPVRVMLLLVVLLWELLNAREALPLIEPDNSAVRPLPSMVLVALGLAGGVKTKLVL